RRDGKSRAIAARFLQAEREVLAHPIYGEAEIEFPFAHGHVAVVHLPGLRRPLANDLNGGIWIKSGAPGEMKAFGKALQKPGNADLIDHFGNLAASSRTHQPACTGVCADYRPGPLKILLCAAAHDAERAVFGPRLAARNRRVDEACAAGL